MNLGTIGSIVTIIAGLIAILAFFWDRIQQNAARVRADKGRINSLIDIGELQRERLQNIETYLSFPEGSRGEFQPSESLANLEAKAFAEYHRHQTNLT
jgi:hypothetical protein